MAHLQTEAIEEEKNSEVAVEQEESDDDHLEQLEEDDGEDGDEGSLENEEITRIQSRANEVKSATSIRMPSQHSKARLSRLSHTSCVTDGAVLDGGGEGDRGGGGGGGDVSSSDDDDRSSSVLITEMKDDHRSQREGVPPGRVTQIRLGRSRKKRATSGRRVKKTEEEEWDTDLETDLKNSKTGSHFDSDEDELGGRSAYLKECERLGVVPVSYFQRHMDDSEITMRYHGLGPQGTQAIAKALKENLTLERLNLCGNWMESEGAMHMCRMLQENDYITELSLAENKLGSAGVIHVAKMLAVNTGLRKLDLSNNGFTDRDTALLVEALEQNKFLRELNLSHNHFGSDAGEILGPAIGANDILDTIDLSWNQIRRKGAVCIAKGLKENIRLKNINLAWNGLGPEGGAAIGDALGVNETLQEIDISGNRIDAHAAVSIAKGIRKNEDLLTLRMGNNPISTKGAIDIATALHDNENSQLTCLDFSDIPVESELLRLCEQMEQKRDLRLVHGPTLRSGNTPDDIGKPAVDPFRRDPLLVLREHIVTHDLRIMELLEKHDENRSYSLEPDLFVSAMEEIAAPFSKDQMDDLIIKLDVNGDGKVFYGDIFQQMENSAIQAQEKGYMGFLPKTPSMHSRNQTFLSDNLNAPSMQPLIESQVIEKETPEAPSTKSSTNITPATASKANTDSAPPSNGDKVVAKLELTKTDAPPS